MLDIGFLEIAVVLVVALLVIGPKRLPKVAHWVGQVLTKYRRAWQQLQAQAEASLSDDNKESDATAKHDSKTK